MDQTQWLMLELNGHEIRQSYLRPAASTAKRIWLVSFVFLLTLTSWSAFSQYITKNAKFRRLSENIQLSNLNITTIAQDSKGFLWVGTLDGLIENYQEHLRSGGWHHTHRACV